MPYTPRPDFDGIRLFLQLEALVSLKLSNINPHSFAWTKIPILPPFQAGAIHVGDQSYFIEPLRGHLAHRYRRSEPRFSHPHIIYKSGSSRMTRRGRSTTTERKTTFCGTEGRKTIDLKLNWIAKHNIHPWGRFSIWVWSVRKVQSGTLY